MSAGLAAEAPQSEPG